MQKNLAAKTALAVALMCACAFAQGTKNQKLTVNMTANRIVVVDGKETKMPGDKAAPGEVVEYAATCKNISHEIVADVKPLIPIPAGMIFVPGSPSPKDFEVSTDGTTYGPYPLKQMVKDASGAEHEVTVPDTAIRFVRWTIGKMAPGETKEVSTRARMIPVAEKK